MIQLDTLSHHFEHVISWCANSVIFGSILEFQQLNLGNLPTLPRFAQVVLHRHLLRTTGTELVDLFLTAQVGLLYLYLLRLFVLFFTCF